MAPKNDANHARPVRALPILGLLVACTSTTTPAPAPATPARVNLDDAAPWSAPAIERATAAFDGRTGEPLSFEQLVDALAGADAVFLGESHTDETTHRAQLAIYEALLERREVVLAMEMFQRDAQPLLDDYVAGRVDEAAFLAGASPWGNYRAAYRPLIERARAGGHPVVASNYPRGLARTVSRGKAEAVAALDDEQRATVPREMHPNTPEYHRRVDNAVRGHLGMMGPREPGDARLWSTQTLWDNSMGEACADALDAHPGSAVLHVNGGFHSAYWDGTVRQLLLRRPATKVATVALVPTANPGVADVGGVPRADYVLFCEQRAADIDSGAHSVYVSRELEYRLHLPELDEGVLAPLVIWLSDDGLTAQDGVDLCRARLGDDVAVLSFEAPYRETQEDLGVGGRWFWPGSFNEDLGAMAESVERAWGYVLRHYPVDPERVCLAGEGTGATVVATTALLTGRMSIAAVAVAPRRYAKIKDLPLPLPEYASGPGPDKSLRVLAAGEAAEWWRAELEEYTAIGFENTLAEPADDPWLAEFAVENELRRALGLDARAEPEGGKRHLRVGGDTPRARQWSRLRAARVAAEAGALVAVVDAEPETDESTPIRTALAPDDEATREALPLCPGPFGGTTVLVLPDDATAEVVASWVALEDDDPLTARSRFHRLRIAGPGLDLAEVLAVLEGQGRMNILICPVAFCADGETMRALRDQVRAFDDRMTLQWLPGLGGGLR